MPQASVMRVRNEAGGVLLCSGLQTALGSMMLELTSTIRASLPTPGVPGGLGSAQAPGASVVMNDGLAALVRLIVIGTLLGLQISCARIRFET